jgi:hypothetical protein
MIAGAYREPLKFRVAGRCWYTPDFLVVQSPHVEDGIRCPALVCVEVKGFMREDACIKLKAAADLYPTFGWILVYRGRRGGSWRVHEVTHRGIGREAIVVPWIHGGLEDVGSIALSGRADRDR